MSKVDVRVGLPANDYLDNVEAYTPELQLKSFIHDTRKALKMSQRELSERSGINQSNLSKIENGIINPSISTIQRLAASLGHKVELRFIPDFEHIPTSTK